MGYWVVTRNLMVIMLFLKRHFQDPWLFLNRSQDLAELQVIRSCIYFITISFAFTFPFIVLAGTISFLINIYFHEAVAVLLQFMFAILNPVWFGGFGLFFSSFSCVNSISPQGSSSQVIFTEIFQRQNLSFSSLTKFSSELVNKWRKTERTGAD